jgi:hypothetical protein
MTSDLMDLMSRELTSDASTRADLEQKLQPLLQEMLAGVRRYLSTPLQEIIDSAGISAVALRNLNSSNGDRESGPDHLRDWWTVKAVLDQLVERSLSDETNSFVGWDKLAKRAPAHEPYHNAGGPALPLPHPTLDPGGPHPLAAWLEQFYTVIREVHSRAFEIVGLRIEGYTDRDIAERLGLGLRLVRRMISDMRLAWETAAEEE